MNKLVILVLVIKVSLARGSATAKQFTTFV